jgi:hypothetical protein
MNCKLHFPEDSPYFDLKKAYKKASPNNNWHEFQADNILVSHIEKIGALKDAKDVQRLINSHEWILERSEPYDARGVIATLRCLKCGAEWSSAIIPHLSEDS